jgi:hypothetical protein
VGCALATDLEQPSYWHRLPPPCAWQCCVPPLAAALGQPALVLAPPAAAMRHAVAATNTPERLDLDLDAGRQTHFSTWTLRVPHVPPAEGGVDDSESGGSEEEEWESDGPVHGAFPEQYCGYTTHTTTTTASTTAPKDVVKLSS